MYPVSNVARSVHGGSGTSLVLNKPSDGPRVVRNGDVLLIKTRGQGIAPLDALASCPGFTAIHGQANDRMHMMLYKIVTDAGSEPSTYTLTTNAASGRIVASIEIVENVDVSSPIAGFHGYQSIGTPNPGTMTSWSLDDIADDLLLIEMFSDERTAGQSHVPSAIPTGFTTTINVQSSLNEVTTGSRTAFWSGEKRSHGLNQAPASSLTWPTGVTTVKASGVAFRGMADPSLPIGLEVKLEDGTLGYLSVLSDGVRSAPANIYIWRDSFPDVDDMLTRTNGVTFAHRGGSRYWPEMSQYAYDHAVYYGYGVLEFSCGWSSDLVPFGLGSQYLDHLTVPDSNGTSINPTTQTWNAISAMTNKRNPVKPGVYQPIYRLDDFAAKYGKTQICIVDPKYGFANQAKLDIMFDIMDANGGPDRFMFKFDAPETDAKLTTTGHARGYKGMNYWGNDITAMAAQQSRWDLIGARFDDATAMAQARTYGKPSWGAVVPTAAGYVTARANGADFVMCTDPAGMPAVNAHSPA